MAVALPAGTAQLALRDPDAADGLPLVPSPIAMVDDVVSRLRTVLRSTGMMQLHTPFASFLRVRPMYLKAEVSSLTANGTWSTRAARLAAVPAYGGADQGVRRRAELAHTRFCRLLQARCGRRMTYLPRCSELSRTL